MCKLTDFELQATLKLVNTRLSELNRHREVGMKTCEELGMIYAEVFPKLEAEYNALCTVIGKVEKIKTSKIKSSWEHAI